jgi:hypothetical protein
VSLLQQTLDEEKETDKIEGDRIVLFDLNGNKIGQREIVGTQKPKKRRCCACAILSATGGQTSIGRCTIQSWSVEISAGEFLSPCGLTTLSRVSLHC